MRHRGIRQIERRNIQITSRRITAMLTVTFTTPPNDTAATDTSMAIVPGRPGNPVLCIKRRSYPSKARAAAGGFWELHHAKCVGYLLESEGTSAEIVDLVGDE